MYWGTQMIFGVQVWTPEHWMSVRNIQVNGRFEWPDTVIANFAFDLNAINQPQLRLSRKTMGAVAESFRVALINLKRRGFVDNSSKVVVDFGTMQNPTNQWVQWFLNRFSFEYIDPFSTAYIHRVIGMNSGFFLTTVGRALQAPEENLNRPRPSGDDQQEPKRVHNPYMPQNIYGRRRKSQRRSSRKKKVGARRSKKNRSSRSKSRRKSYSRRKR